MFNFKLTAFVAIGAFLLSFIIGLFSKVTAGALFLRGVFWAILMGALFSGCRIVLKKFLPELFEVSEVPEEETDELDDEESERRGDKVNIVLDDDGYDTVSGLDDDSPESGGFSSGGAPEREYGVGMSEGEDGELETLDDAEDDDEQPAARSRDGEPGDFSPGRRPSEAESDDEADSVEEVEAFEDGGMEGDIGAFEGQFSGEAESDIDTLPGAPGRKKVLEVMGGEHDPEEAAKAIKTMMKKDQEG